MTTEKTSVMLLAVICLAGIALAIAQPASVSSNGTVLSVNLTAWCPLDETINDIEGATRTFNVSINQPVTVSWRINGTEVLNQSGVNISEYTATAAAGYCNVTAYAYNQNSSDMRTWWWTVTVKDTTPPEIVDYAPTDTKVSVKANVTATFNETMNPFSLNNATLSVCNSSGSSVTGYITYDSALRTVTFDPLSALEYNETYYVTITEGVHDLAGNNISPDFCWNFTTCREINVPIVISGYVQYTESAPLSVNVAITNLDTSENFTVKTVEDSSYYRMQTDSTHLHVGDRIRFNASDGETYTEAYHSVTEADIETGGFTRNFMGSKPDLIINTKSETWADWCNSTFNVTYTIRNIGDGNASKSNTTIYVDGVLTKKEAVGPLAPNEYYTSTCGPFNRAYHKNTTTIRVCADGDDVVNESIGENNNCRENELEYQGPLPDLGFLTTAHIQTSVSIDKYGRFVITYYIANKGEGYAGPSNTTISITNVSINGSVSDVIIREPVPEMSSSGGYQYTLRPSSFTCACNHTVMFSICIDGDKAILESDENNNYYNQTLFCPASVCMPDLKITNQSMTWINRKNMTFNVTYTVRNFGITNASASVTNISGVMYDDPVPALAPGENYTCTVGPFYGNYGTINICADWYDSVAENNESNNCRPVTISTGGDANLVIFLWDKYWVDPIDKTYRITYEVCNYRGTPSTNLTTVHVYIDGNLSATDDDVPILAPPTDGAICSGAIELPKQGFEPFKMTGKNDTIKVCVEWEGGIECNKGKFEYCGCLADDRTRLFMCDDRIDRSCTFVGDLNCDRRQSGKTYPHGLSIVADNITIDGNGYKILGEHSACERWVTKPNPAFTGIKYSGCKNVTVKNLEVRDFCNGISVKNADNNRIENCMVHDNGVTVQYNYGITVLNSSYTTIDNCSVYNNTGILTEPNIAGGHGINFDESSDYCRVMNSNIFHNYRSGILASPTCKYLYLANNHIEENGYCNESGFCAGVNLHWKGGYGIATNSTVENNVIRNNTGPGIYVTQGYTTLTNNLVSESKNGTNVTGNGIFVDGGWVTYLYNNTCCENEGTDIFDRGFTTYGDDNTCNTTFNYDDEGTIGCNFYCRGVNGACVGATRTFRCGDFVTESCTFNRSISCRGSAGDGLIVGADNVTIDGAGYALTGNYSGIGILSNHTNVTITNLQVEDFATGMKIGNANTIENCVVRTNLVTGLNVSANNGTVRNNRIYDNAGPGIFVDGVNSTFVNNTVARNKGYGIYLSSNTGNNTLIANALGDNEGMEIYNDNGASNTGYNNTCDIAYNYNDTGMTYYNCTYAWTVPDLVISDKHEEWIDEKSARYSVTYTVDNIGKPNSRSADSSTTYLYINYAFTATDGVSSLNASANYSSTFNKTPEMKEDKDTIKVCADGADAVKENNEADTYYYNDVVSEYYNLAGFFADKEANNCLENVFSKCGDMYEWDEDAACVAAGGTEYKCGDPDPDKRIVMKSCTFNGNMKCPSGHGLVVGTSGITIDGNGYAIGRDESASSCTLVAESNPDYGDCGIYNSGYDRVTITKLEILHFCNGIGIHGSKGKPVSGNTIENCRIHDNGNSAAGMSHGIHMVCVKDTKIRYNDIYKNRGTGVSCGDGGNGIFLYAGGIGNANNVISGNTLHDNDRAGFWTKQGMQGCTINNNKVWGNSRGGSSLGSMTGGIVLQCVQSSHNRIEDNEVWDNDGRCGIFIGGDDNTISNNNVYDNKGDGINIGRNDGSRNNKLNDNTVCDNKDMDIRTCGDDYGTTGNNNFCDTTDNYADTNAPEGSKCAKKCSTVPKPDLVIMDKNETWIVEGKSYNVTYTVQNIGEVNANASTTHIQIVNGNSRDDPVPALAPNATHTYTVGSFTMSGDSDMIEVYADYEGLVEKQGLSSRDNNRLPNTWWALPDLKVMDILLPDRLSFGMPNIITAMIENAGTVRTNGTFTVALFIMPSTVPIDTAPAPSELTAGRDTTVKLSWTPPAPGRYTLKVVTDYGDAIPESNEDNNERTLTITEELGIEMPEGPIRGGGGGGGGVSINKENVYGPEVATGEISTGEATKEVPINETKQVKEEKKMGTGHPFGEGGMIETVKVVAPVFLVVALITIVVVLFYLGYRKEKKMHRRGDKKIR
ncbi:hypothetical protein C5S31_09480 [ANME-1 cluster archaeon GoMg2]|nr:hypothetical protein [ANME-1 cluster archaeon GoMg2]